MSAHISHFMYSSTEIAKFMYILLRSEEVREIKNYFADCLTKTSKQKRLSFRCGS